MTTNSPIPSLRPRKPEDVISSTLLGICCSLKPPPGAQSRSAARSLLTQALTHIGVVYPAVLMLDLRDHPPPLFDGRPPGQYEDGAAEFSRRCVERSGALLFSIPAYWSGMSGVFKNFVDVLCGAIYDMPSDSHCVFAGKATGILVVGADERSAVAAAGQSLDVLRSVGAAVVEQPVVVADPRTLQANANEWPHLIALAGELARTAYLIGAGSRA